MATSSQPRSRSTANRRSDGGISGSLRSLLESPLFREVLANALVAAAGAAAATLVRKRPETAERVARVAAAATSLTATTSAEEMTEAGRDAVRDLATRLGSQVIPGLISAVAGPDSRRTKKRESNGSAEPTKTREPRGRTKRKSASATQWR